MNLLCTEKKKFNLPGQVFTKIQIKSLKKKQFRYFIENSSEHSNNNICGSAGATSGLDNNIGGRKTIKSSQ